MGARILWIASTRTTCRWNWPQATAKSSVPTARYSAMSACQVNLLWGLQALAFARRHRRRRAPRRPADGCCRQGGPAAALHGMEHQLHAARSGPRFSYISAPCILSKLKAAEGLVQGMSYRTFSDLFEEPGPRQWRLRSVPRRGSCRRRRRQTSNIDAIPTTWAFHVAGLEEAVPLNLVSIPDGPVISAIGRLRWLPAYGCDTIFLDQFADHGHDLRPKFRRQKYQGARACGYCHVCVERPGSQLDKNG